MIPVVSLHKGMDHHLQKVSNVKSTFFDYAASRQVDSGQYGQ